MTDIFEALAAPFPPEAVSWRIGRMAREGGKGMALAYIDARDVMERLDEVVGPANWQDRYEFVGARTVCYLSIRVDGEWITKADGAGDSDVEAEKGAISDALKRAGVKWGIARYLYAIPSPWVAVENKQIVKDEYEKLENLLEQVTGQIEWGSPGEKAMARALYQTIKSTVQTADDVRLYRDANKGVLANLRKAPREQIDALLERITEAHNAKG
jgi:hypothetical protein